jgi:hypothetical protein
MYIDKAVALPRSLRGVPGITASNVHSKHTTPTGKRCAAPAQDGKCMDCRTCWSRDTTVSYEAH